MYDEELEKVMLYFLIFEEEQYPLDENDFINPRNKKIINAINKLKAEKKEVSMITVKSEIKANSLEVLEYLSSLHSYALGASPDDIYNKLIELSKKRKLFNLLKTKISEIEGNENIDALSEDVIKEINKIEQVNEKEITFAEQVAETIKKLEESMTSQTDYSLYTGMLDLDKLTCGLHNQELTIIGARPGVGKTTFALQIAEYIAKKGVETAIISLEMSDTQIIQKMLSRNTKVNSYKMRQGILEDKDIENIASSSVELAELPIDLITKARTLQQIEVIARKLKNKKKLGLLIIDYIQLIKNKGKFNSREQEVADITRTLKLLSLELNIPIIGLCQLNRNATRQEPLLSDLRESGAIEQDADNVIFLYQEKDLNEGETCVDITIKLAKQRAGQTGKAYMRFNKQISEFRNIVR